MGGEDIGFVTEKLRADIADRLASLNREMGRSEDWYSDMAESALSERLSETHSARADLFGLESMPQWMHDTIDGMRVRSSVERLTAWEFRSTRERYNSHVAELTSLATKGGMKVSPVVIVEGPTGIINAQIVRDQDSGVCVAYVEEGLLNFGFNMLKILISCLPIPDEQPDEQEASVRIDAELAGELLEASGGQFLRLFEVMCQYLLGETTSKLQPYPLHPLQLRVMAPMWACLESFIVAHEFSHALHGDLHGGGPVFKQGPTSASGMPMDLEILLGVLLKHPEHLQEMNSILPELQADFEASDLVVALRLNEAGAVFVLLAPLLYLEFIDMLEFCLFRLSYGRDVARPAFLGNPSPAVRKAYLIAQIEHRLDPSLYRTVETAFLEVQKICSRLLRPVSEQMHILWHNGVPYHPRWRTMVRRMKPTTA